MNWKIHLYRAILWLITLSLLLMMFGFSAQEGVQSGSISGKIARPITDSLAQRQGLTGKAYWKLYAQVDFAVRKTAHFLEYTLLGILLTLLLATMGIMYAGRGKSFSVYKTFTNVNTSTDSSYKSVGMLATTVQELRYMVFGSSGSVIITPSSLGTDTRRLYSSNSYNVIESIDFAKLAESADNIMCRTTDEYLAQVVPTRKNNYTGLLQDYNLITICAESFCPWFISEELTPTLYRLTHEGFVFDNFYQPGWGQSTTGGEYAVMTGLLPTWVNGNVSFYATANNSMPFALGNQFRALGYTTAAYHNNIYNYYRRDKTHPNLGYDYQGQGNGLQLTEDGSWPYSDLEMIQNTITQYIDLSLIHI